MNFNYFNTHLSGFPLNITTLGLTLLSFRNPEGGILDLSECSPILTHSVWISLRPFKTPAIVRAEENLKASRRRNIASFDPSFSDA